MSDLRSSTRPRPAEPNGCRGSFEAHDQAGHREARDRVGSKAGIQAQHAAKLRVQLTALHAAKRPQDLTAPSWRRHALKGDRKDYYAIVVNGNWRVVFRFTGTDVELVDYLDYH